VSKFATYSLHFMPLQLYNKNHCVTVQEQDVTAYKAGTCATYELFISA